VKEGDRITKEEALEYFRKDVERFEKAVSESVTVQLKQNEFDALVSLAFNIGAGAFKKSTLLKMLNSGNFIGAASQFLRWNKAGGEVSKGLARRRDAEKDMFLGVSHE
jgi:lysozyme